MDQMRGVLLLTDPLRPQRSGGAVERLHEGERIEPASGEGAGSNVTALAFREGERCLPQAQAALWKLRRRCGWICVAAQGAGAGIALALAAQLPVERVALIDGAPEEVPRSPRARELVRLEAFARRNLALVIAELLLVNVGEAQRRRLVRGLVRARGVRWVDGGLHLDELTRPWDNGK